jgi:hypothetical protein
MPSVFVTLQQISYQGEKVPSVGAKLPRSNRGGEVCERLLRLAAASLLLAGLIGLTGLAECLGQRVERLGQRVERLAPTTHG